MTSVEKRRSGRKRSGRHRKHSDGGYSDTSSGGSFLDETDREVSNLTDRAFRSLCIGDEAVYNDSDLGSFSPCIQRDRQLAFSQSCQGGDREDREREELKRAAHESFSLRMQQYGQDWTHGGMYGAEIQRDPQWGVYGERTQGRVSATFQHSFVDTSQQEESLGEDQLSFLSNGATELSSQQRRSRSRVSSLIRAFNSEGQRDGAGMDDKLREWNNETSWDKSALMSIQRELSEFSTSYQQNFNSGHLPSAGSFSSRDTNFYSSEVAQMNSASSFMRSSHSKHSMSTQVNCNSNFFIHSEFSPFKVWRDYNRFPFQQGEVSGFMHCSEFPKWYETPMYRELSLEAQPQGPYGFVERGIRYPSNNLGPVVPPTHPRSTSTSTMLQKASAVEKRCESELTGHYPHRKRTQSLGTNRLPLQRPSTASPTSEMSRRVRDTISSVKALQQKIKMMTEQNITSGITENQHGVLCSNDNFIPFGNDVKTATPNVVSSNTSTTPYNTSQLLTPSVHAHQEAETSEVQQYAGSPEPVEHPPVRAESRGATPDIRMSSYRSRATSLLFNLKDNRKRVKSTYSPPKFKGLETLGKNKQASIQEPRDTVIDMPDFPDLDIQLLQVGESSRTNDASHQYGNQYNSPGLSLTTVQYSQYQTAQMQSEMVHHPGFTGFIPENDASNQPANGQNLHADLSAYTPYNQAMIDNVETLRGDTCRLKSSYTATETPRLNPDNNQPREYLISTANAEQHFNETVGREFTKADRYQQLQNNKHDYSNVSSQDGWRQTNSQDTENHSLKAVSPWKLEINALMEKDHHAQAYQSAAVGKEKLNSPRDKYKENQPNINTELEKIELSESSGVGAGLDNPNISNQLPQNAPFNNDTVENPAYYGQQQPGAFEDKYVLQKYYGLNTEKEMKNNYLTQNYNRYTDQEYRNQHTLYSNTDKSMQRKQYTPIPKGYEMQSLQSKEAKPQLHNMQKSPSFNSNNVSAPTMENQVKDRQFVEVKAEQSRAEHLKAQHTQAELAKGQHWAQVEQPRAELAGLILVGQTVSEKVKAEQAKEELTEYERANQAKAEHIKEVKRKEEQTEQSREKPAEQTKGEKVTEEPKHISEDVGPKHLREEQGEQVRAIQAEAERLKEEHIKTELAKTEQARLEQAKADQARRERVKAKQTEEERVRAEQAERENMETEQFRTEKIKAEQAKLQQIQAQQAKAEQEKTEVVEVGKVDTNHMQVEDVKQEKIEKDSIQGHQVNAEQHTTQITTTQAKLEQTKMELAKAELTKKAVTQPVKCEPDRVEQVKTELAKAKAELAKIKEKMRGEQKEKAHINTVLTKEDGIKTDVPLKLNIHKNEEYKYQDQATQMHQQREDSAAVSRQYSDQANSALTEYERLREKYGFNDVTSSNKNKASVAGNVSSKDVNETSAFVLDKVEIKNNEKSNDKSSPTSRVATANSENKEEVGGVKPTELTESQYVYSESSKEFKLSGSNYLPINVDKRANSNTDKVKDDNVEKLEKRDALKHADISQQRDSDSAKPLPLERIPKSTEPSAGQGKDHHITPPRILSHKERAQTKQEILTSKIKAHAEKEISAIKEKGFAVRDGFMSKNSIKQFASLQSNNIRQRPPTQDVKHESTMSSNITPKHHMEHSGIPMEPVKSVSSSSSSTIPVKPAATTSQVVDHSQKQVPKEPMKSTDNMLKPAREAKQMGSDAMYTGEGLVENRKKENQSELKSIIQHKEQSPENKRGKQDANQGENSGKQEDDPSVDTDNLKKEEDPSLQATALALAETSKPVTTEKAESKHEAVPEDSAASSLSLVFGQNETPVADDSLQITGIMVTVRERKPSMDNGQSNNTTLEQMNIIDKECRNSETENCLHSSGLEVSKGNTSSKEGSFIKPKDRVVQNTYPTMKEDQSKVVSYHPENTQDNSTLETIQNSEDATVKETNLQQDGSSVNARPQTVTQPLEPLTEKGVPSAATVLAKNKVLAETQPLLYIQDTIPSERKDYTSETPKENSAKSLKKVEVSSTEENSPQKRQTTHTNEKLMAKVVNTAISDKDDSNRAHAETVINHDIQPSVKEDLTIGINLSTSRNIDDKSAPLAEENKSTPPKSFNKTCPSDNLTENKNTHVSPKDQYKKAHIGENVDVDDNVHIGSIAIRVVPAVTDKDNLKMAGKHHVTTVPSDAVAANEQKQVASPGLEENVNTLHNEDRTNKDLTPASSGNQIKDSLEDKLRVQRMLSSVSDSLKINNQQNHVNAFSENTENGKPEKGNESGKSVDESNIQQMMEDYFQVQGVSETNNEKHQCTNVEEISDTVSKGRELPGLLPNKSAISNAPSNEGKNEAFVLDESIRKTVESSSGGVQDENMKRKNRETEDKLASKQSNGPTERQSNKNEKTEAGQAIHIRKHHSENQSSLSARDRQSSRISHPTKEKTGEEKPEVKPKPKERVSTIPEISAIADYARLKVIVSEDEANPIQEFPPNKKEGFFPLIQSRHSRRPVFTVDPQDFSVKEKSLPTKKDVSSKVNKEPKPLVFPITEKEHQRTGMFKLGDKERQEKMLLDAKANEGVLDTGVKHAKHLKERKKSPVAHLKKQGSEEQVSGTDNRRVRHVEQSIHQPNNLSLQAATSSSAVNRPRSNSASQHPKLLDSSDPRENALAKIGKEKTEKMRQEMLATRHKETEIQQQSRAKQASRIEEEKRAEDRRIKHMIEETRASLAEEERRAVQREEERRTREREAIAMKIKERREKQREAERAAEKERTAKKEEEMRAKQREEERRMKETEEKRRIKIEEEYRAKLREEEERIKANGGMKRVKQRQEEIAAQKEQQRRAAQEEQRKRVVQEQQRRRAGQEEQQQRRAAQEEQQQRRAAQEEQQQRRAAQEEQQGRAAQENKQRRAAQEEQQQRRAAQEEQQRRAAQEDKQRRAAQEEQQRRAAQEDKQRRAAQEEQQRRAAQEEHQQRRATQEEQQQRRAAQEEQQQRAAQEEHQQRRATQEERQQRRAAQEEQQRRAAQAEQQRRAAHEEQQQRAAQEEQQRRAAQEELQRRAAQEEQQRRAAQEEQQRRAAQEEQQLRAAQEEQQSGAAQEEQQRIAAQEEQQRRAAQEEQQRIAAQEEQQRRAAQEEQQRIAAQDEQQRRAAQEEQQRRAAQEEQQRRAAQEEQQRRAVLIEEQRRAKQIEEKIFTEMEEKKKKKQREEEKAAQISGEERINPTQEQIKEQRGERQTKEEWMRAQTEEDERRAVEEEKMIIKQREEKQAKEERTGLLEKSQAALKEEERVTHKQMLAKRRAEIRAEEEEKFITAHREKERHAQMEEQKQAAQRMDALQYYAITSTEPEKIPRERQPCSPVPSQQRHNPAGLGSTEESGSHTRSCRPHAPASPAPSLPRSNTSSPALGAKPSMFRVKDNTFRGSSLTKSVKPRFHKNFGEDFRVGSPMERGSERGEEEQEVMRRSAGTPIYPDAGLNRLHAIKESSTFRPYSSQDHSTALPQHRPYSRRSVALDEDDSRSIISIMSEDVESFATSAADLADIRGLYEYERPDSACSFSSDVSRSLGKPPTVPPKSEKALRRAQRLTTRRIKKELSKMTTDRPAGVEKSLQEVSSIPSSSIEVRPSSRQAVSSPHFSSPVSLAHAPTLGSSLPSSHTEHQSSHSSFYASPHATGPISLPAASPHATGPISLPAASPHASGPISLPAASPHATGPISLPVASPHATGPISLPVASPHATAPVSLPVASLNAAVPASHTAAPRTVAHIPSSPTLHHASHPAPVTQYHVESSYPHSYPLTQRKVLQDLGSGQYFVVDVPVQVKTKTFFDPETGKYVQLNVRESGQSTSRPQPQQTYPQPQLQPQVQAKLQQQNQTSPAGKPVVLYQGNQGYPQNYQPPGINHRSTAPSTLHQDQQPVVESHSYRCPAPEVGQISEGHRYSPEKTPYMDTVNNKNKTYNPVYNTHGPYESFSEGDINSQLSERSVCENDNSTHSQCQPRDIITMSELEDFMEVSDW